MKTSNVSDYKSLEEPVLTRSQIRSILGNKRFNMSGYDNNSGGRGKRGNCVVHNQDVLNTFASFGIYEYVEYLYLDFYKGAVNIHYKYWREDLGEQFLLEANNYNLHSNVGRVYDGLGGWTTSAIIQKVLELTIHSGKKTRRVNE